MPHKGTLQCTYTIHYPPDCIHVDLTFLRWIFLGATCFIIQLSCGQHDIKEILQVQAKKPCFYYFLQGPSQVYKERLQAGERLLASMFVRREDRKAHYAVLPFFLCLYYMVCPPSEDDWTAFSKKCLHSLPSGVWATPDFPGRGGPDSDWCIKVRDNDIGFWLFYYNFTYIYPHCHTAWKITSASRQLHHQKHALCMLQFTPNKLPFDFLTVPAHSGPRQKHRCHGNSPWTH